MKSNRYEWAAIWTHEGRTHVSLFCRTRKEALEEVARMTNCVGVAIKLRYAWTGPARARLAPDLLRQMLPVLDHPRELEAASLAAEDTPEFVARESL